MNLRQRNMETRLSFPNAWKKANASAPAIPLHYITARYIIGGGGEISTLSNSIFNLYS
jgi:hypothetical protein